MIKKLTLILLSTLSFSVLATEKITIYWGFSPASQPATNYRMLVTELNKIQNKYEFVFDTRVGAGGAVAARHILQNPNTTLLGVSSTFFIRANFDKSTGYSVDQFQPVIVQSTGAPVVLFSNKYKTIADIKPAEVTTNAISGFGSHSNLMATIFSEYHRNTIIVNYPTLAEANRDTQGKHIDTSWWWLSDADAAVNGNRGFILGITGTQSIKGYKTFASQGIRGFEKASNNQLIVASGNMPPAKLKELHELLRIANQSLSMQTLYAKDYSTTANLNWEQTQTWYHEQSKFWTQQSSKVKSPLVDQK